VRLQPEQTQHALDLRHGLCRWIVTDEQRDTPRLPVLFPRIELETDLSITDQAGHQLHDLGEFGIARAEARTGAGLPIYQPVYRTESQSENHLRRGAAVEQGKQVARRYRREEDAG